VVRSPAPTQAQYRRPPPPFRTATIFVLVLAPLRTAWSCPLVAVRAGTVHVRSPEAHISAQWHLAPRSTLVRARPYANQLLPDSTVTDCFQATTTTFRTDHSHCRYILLHFGFAFLDRLDQNIDTSWILYISYNILIRSPISETVCSLLQNCLDLTTQNA
jgi:hypothetical protein